MDGVDGVQLDEFVACSVPGVEDMSPYMMHRAHQASQMMGKPTGGNVDHHLRNVSQLHCD